MKKIFLFLFLTVSLHSALAQQAKQQPLGINLENYEYPYPVHFIQLAEQGQQLQMAYMDVRPAKPNGKAVLLLHGKNFNGAYWQQTAEALAQKGYRVVIPDQVGFGKSSKPEHLQYTFQLLAKNTKAVIDTLQIKKITVLGHSMGGMLATRFALMYPESTEKFVLVNPIGLEDWKLKVPYQTVDQWYKNELNQNYEKIKQYQQENYYGGQWKPAYDKWVVPLAGWTLNKDYPRIAWNSALTYDMIFTQPVVYEFAAIQAPALLIIGQRDKTALGKNLVSEEVRKTMGNYPQLGKDTARKIKNSSLVELNNVGHLPHIEAFDRFITPLIQFLDK
ncbi:alpha/beta fold hydrolase [Pontibacter sp. SGAir0037]|uniref:alpha/beta fold hydrolase n=1 Tax=Pontibacter sp. SGAir0037 TaxID=2571030 RepID=UPI0010CCCF67|nr:alpha/beta hydrolase [Pontibacter sp. SGAir0037]QCR25067.1 alpha/beta hydrolase [Pontibacter sp. SGAir0037]